MNARLGLIEAAWTLSEYAEHPTQLESVAEVVYRYPEEVDAKWEWLSALLAALDAESEWGRGSLGTDADGVITLRGERVYWRADGGCTEWSTLDSQDDDVQEYVAEAMAADAE